MNNNNGKPNSSRENLTNNNLINNCSGQDTENPATLMNNNKYSKTNISTITTNNVDHVDIIEDDGDDDEGEEEDEEEDEEQQIVEEIATPKISEDSYQTKDEFCENKC